MSTGHSSEGTDKFADLPEARARGLRKMEEVYGFDMADGEGDFFRYTADHLFGDIWQRPGLTTRDRRLLLIGLLAGRGAADVLGIQIPAAYANGELSEDELHRVEATVKAAHLATVKVQVVVHAFYRAVRRDLPPSTGVEEPPIRRGVPDWQRWMSFPPMAPEAQALLDEAGVAFGTGEPPPPLRLLTRWPAAAQVAWRELKRVRGTEPWKTGASSLRRRQLPALLSHSNV